MFRSAAATPAKLHAVDPAMFPDPLGATEPVADAHFRAADYASAIEARQKAERIKTPHAPSPLDAGVAHLGANMLAFTLVPLDDAGVRLDRVPRPVVAESVRRDQRRKKSAETKKIRGVVAEEAAVAAAGSDSDDASDSRKIAYSASLEDDETLPPALRRLRPGDVELAFLGTGSSAPAKYRNVSGIFLDVAVKKTKDAFADEDEDTRGSRAAMFMDVGEGTLGQMVRAYGEEGAKDRLRRLRVAWISHIHADHHVGLVSVLAARREALREEWEARREKNESSPSERERFAPPPLLVVGPHPLRRFLDAFSQVEPLDYRFADCRAALWDPLSEAEEADPEMSEMSSDDDRRESAPDRDPLARRAAYSASHSDAARIRAAAKSMGLASFRAVPVVHCAQSYALVIVAEGGDAEEVGGDHDHDHDTITRATRAGAARGRR